MAKDETRVSALGPERPSARLAARVGHQPGVEGRIRQLPAEALVPAGDLRGRVEVATFRTAPLQLGLLLVKLMAKRSLGKVCKEKAVLLRTTTYTSNPQ